MEWWFLGVKARLSGMGIAAALQELGGVPWWPREAQARDLRERWTVLQGA